MLLPRRMKTCRKCGEEKDPALFPRNKQCRDGLSSWCKKCHSDAVSRSVAKRRASDPEFRERQRLRSAAWREANPEKKRAADAFYRETHFRFRMCDLHFGTYPCTPEMAERIREFRRRQSLERVIDSRDSVPHSS